MVTFNLTFLWKESSVALAHATGRCRMYTMQQQTLSQCKSKFSIHPPIHPFLLPPPTPALHLPSACCGRWSLLGSSDICCLKQWLPCAGPQSEPEACCYCVWFIHMQISGHGARMGPGSWQYTRRPHNASIYKYQNLWQHLDFGIVNDSCAEITH